MQGSLNRYQYKAYGLNIGSSIRFPELLSGDGPPDVKIRYGTVPDTLANAKAVGVCCQARPDKLLLSIQGVGRYLVSEGGEIIVHPAPGVKNDQLRLFLLGSAFGALLHQRGFLPLHASAIEVNGGCVAILGFSGSGKSTLACAFAKRGYPIVADDICSVSIPKDGLPVVNPGYPQLKLWADAANELGEKLESMRQVRPELEKYALPLKKEFSRNPLLLQRIYTLTTTNTRKPILAPLKGPEKFAALKDHTYRLHFLEGLGGKVPHFQKIAAVANAVPVTCLIRPIKPFLLDQLVELLERDLFS